MVDKKEIYDTHVQLTKEFKEKVDEFRKAKGMTLQGLIRIALEEYIKARSN